MSRYRNLSMGVGAKCKNHDKLINYTVRVSKSAMLKFIVQNLSEGHNLIYFLGVEQDLSLSFLLQFFDDSTFQLTDNMTCAVSKSAF